MVLTPIGEGTMTREALLAEREKDAAVLRAKWKAKREAMGDRNRRLGSCSCGDRVAYAISRSGGWLGLCVRCAGTSAAEKVLVPVEAITHLDVD